MFRLRPAIKNTQFSAVASRFNKIKPNFFAIYCEINSLKSSLKQQANLIFLSSRFEND